MFGSCLWETWLIHITEVAQQSKIRHKDDFIIAFAPVIAEAAAVAYKGAPAELQAKLKRVIDVWRDRSIFEAPIQAAIDARIGGKYRMISTHYQV